MAARVERRHRRYAFAAMACVMGVIGMSGPALQAALGRSQNGKPVTGKTLGFVMTSFEKATYLSKDDCPDGFVPRGIEGVLAGISKPERERLTRPENAKERKLLEPTEGFDELCMRPDWLPARPHRMVKGKISYGL